MSDQASPVLSREALNRALLARQLLLERATLTVTEALEHLVGMQSQAPSPPYPGLWTRLVGFRPDDLASLITSRDAVRVVLMRSTIHLVTARDCLRIRPVLAESLARTLKGIFGHRLDGLDLPAVVAAGHELLAQRPLTLGELGALLGQRWPEHEPFALANVVRNLSTLVQPPPRGLWGESSQAVHATADSWIGAPPAADTSPDALVVRYLAAFGPASVKDVQHWSGMTRLAAPMARLRPQLLTFRDENGQQLFDLPGAPRPDPGTPSPVRFLPEFDNILLSHADRSRILTDDRRRLVFTRNGLVRPTILVDGFVRGRWSVERSREAAALLIEPFTALDAASRDALEDEGSRLLDFLAPEAGAREIRFG